MPMIEEYRPGRRIPKMKTWVTVANHAISAMNKIMETGRVGKNSIPPFLQKAFIALEAQLKMVQSHEISLPDETHGYEVIRYAAAATNPKMEREEFHSFFDRMILLMTPVKRSRRITDEERLTAKTIQELFVKIRSDGSEEYYDEMMEESHRDHRPNLWQR